MKIAVVAVDTRGGVQPYAALALGLQAAGHAVRVIAPEDSFAMLTSLGLDARALTGSMQEAARRAAGTRGVVPRGVRAEMVGQSLVRARELVAATDGVELVTGGVGGSVLGVDIAESRGVPFVFTHLHPVGVPTRELPGVLASWMPAWLGPLGRRAGQAFTQLALTAPFLPAIRTVRRDVLGLPVRRRTPDPALPVIFGFSPHVVPPPSDWPPTCRVTGYWFLPAGADWEPPPGLVDFLAAGPPPVSVGFGSMPEVDPAGLTELVLAAVRRAGLRALLLSGWGALDDVRAHDVFVADAVPHDWLFPQVAAAVHHGGAGTTAAALRAGVPAVIVPFAVDQPFWGARVATLGAGPPPVPRRRLTVDRLAGALRAATSDGAMRSAAADVGRLIRSEDGVGTAVRVFDELAGSRSVDQDGS